MLNSAEYWKDRLQTIGDAGAGSGGPMRLFKIDTINDFIRENRVQSVLDFGYGDCRVSAFIRSKIYTGVDITDKFAFMAGMFIAEHTTLLRSPFDIDIPAPPHELVICLDVLFHILPHEIEYLHKTLDNIYKYSNRHIIIYAQDSRQPYHAHLIGGVHVCNSPWRQYLEQMPIVLEKQIAPHGQPTSSQFFIYRKI